MTLRGHGGSLPSNFATLDHIIPRARGGRDVVENFELMCLRCNHKKDDLMPGEADAAALKEAQDAARAEESIAIKTASGIDDLEIAKACVELSCRMCRVMGLEPNASTLPDDEVSLELSRDVAATLNWQFMLPAAVCAYQELGAVMRPDGDLLAIAAPDNSGFLLRIDKHGELHMRPDIIPGTPLFTLVNGRGDVTLAVGPVPPGIGDAPYPPVDNGVSEGEGAEVNEAQ
jgi:hypothetical protein